MQETQNPVKLLQEMSREDLQQKNGKFTKSNFLNDSINL